MNVIQTPLQIWHIYGYECDADTFKDMNVMQTAFWIWMWCRHLYRYECDAGTSPLRIYMWCRHIYGYECDTDLSLDIMLYRHLYGYECDADTLTDMNVMQAPFRI
jgi:hypothetical protein